MKKKSRLIAAFAAAAALTVGAWTGLHDNENARNTDVNTASQPYTISGPGHDAQEHMIELAQTAYLTQYPDDATLSAPTWDPFRHAYTSARVAQFYGDAAARIAGDANEVKTDNDTKRMDYYNNDKAIALWGDDPAVGSFDEVDVRLAAAVKTAITDGTLKSSLEDVPEDYRHISVFLNADEVLTYAKHNPEKAAAMAAAGVSLAAGGAIVHHRHKKEKADAPKPA